MVSRILSYLAIALLWFLHFLPLPLLARAGERMGILFFLLGKRRRDVAALNIRWCFPELGPVKHAMLVKAHFQVLGRSFLERGLLWWASRERLQKLIHVDGFEKIRALQAVNRPIILLAPHFVGLDVGGIGIALQQDVISMYSTQKNAVFDTVIRQGRERFGKQRLITRQDGIRSCVKAMKQGLPFYYLPDMDFGDRDSIFVPFFGIQTATITGVSRLARLAGAAVVPCITRVLPGGQGYAVELMDAWENFPSDDAEADTRRVNAFIENIVLTMPEQYYWVHRRFKSRPAGEPRPY